MHMSVDVDVNRSPYLDSDFSATSDRTLYDPYSPLSPYDLKSSLKGKTESLTSSYASALEEQEGERATSGFTQCSPQKEWVPAHHGNRTLVLCFDGTGDQFDSDNSNVVQLFSMLRKDDTSQQLVYYQPGIGTYTGTDIPIIEEISKTLDEMFAMNISTHIKDGYKFLMENYTDGDKICLFGFSRGAYTARALAGMLQKVGLLPRSNDAQLSFAYDMYSQMATDADDKDFDEEVELVETFKRTFCREVKVEFLGVWDTVNSVGIIPRTLPFVYMNNGVRHLRHALSLDERRVRFMPSLASAYVPHGAAQRGERAERAFEDAVNAAAGAHCDVREVWFAGVHADVGGGSVKNNTRHALARIPLRWMVREAFRCGTGLVFDAAMLQQIGLGLTRMPDGSLALADPPPRLPAHALAAHPHVRVDREDEHEPPCASWAWRALAAVAGAARDAVKGTVQAAKDALAAPVRRLFGRTPHRAVDAARARGRHVLPSRMHPVHARAAHRARHGAAGAAPPEDPHALHEEHMVERCPEYEAVEELADALSMMHDQLSTAGGWMRLLWLAMEYLPARVRVERPVHIKHTADAWEWWSRPKEPGDRLVWQWVRNCGRGRTLADEVLASGMHVHRSVKTRLEARGIRLKHAHRRGDVYVPQLGHKDWNVDVPLYWEWVD